MTAILTVESTLTDRYQTTVPESVRRALHLGKRDKIQFTLLPDGRVVLSRSDDSGDDPILGQFLDFLAKDIEQNPQHVHAMSTNLVKRIQSLLGGIEIDLEAPLLADDVIEVED
jgi:antitoxin PrlF